jgi:CRISPR-associated endonuclease Cas3-HD
MYFAHSVEDQDRARWQVLADHLLNVSELAATRASKFGAGRLGALSGMLHDLGKYTEDFQAYIAGNGGSVDHSTAGAQEVLSMVSGQDGIAAQIAAYGIAGHHSGLPDRTSETGSLSDRLKKALPPLAAVWKNEIAPDATTLSPLGFKLHVDHPSLRPFQLAMLGRMVFSCLVDADYIDTERFYAASRGASVDRTGQTIMIEPKGVNACQVKNFLHVFICTNAKWAIPATQDERRWFILNVGEKHMRDFPYFKKITDDMKDGGRAHLLHYLLNLDISKFEFRNIPDTEAMQEQQERTRSGIELLVEGWCRDGVAPFSQPDRPQVIVTSGSDAKIPSGFDNFIQTRAPEDLRRLGPTRIKRALTREWGTSHFRGRIAGLLVSGIELPPLADLRKTFETRCNGGKPINWPAGSEWVASNDDGFIEAHAETPTKQTAEDTGEPSESDLHLDEIIKIRLAAA